MSHLLILTDHELIIIHDDPESPKSADNTRYGGVWNYLPLNKIAGVDQTEQETGLLALTVQLPHADHVEVLFQPDRRAELERFVTQLKSVCACPDPYSFGTKYTSVGLSLLFRKYFAVTFIPIQSSEA